MASKCTKCGNTENYNFALNIGLCNPCIGERIAELEAEVQKLGDGIESMNNKWVKIRRRLDKRIEELETGIRDVCDLINNSKAVSKWKIFNWLDKVLLNS